MGLDKKLKKRLIFFIIIPLVLIVPLVTDDIVLKIISAIIIIIYTGFIIFFRDSFKVKETEVAEDVFTDNPTWSQSGSYHDTNPDESFSIISKNKTIEIKREGDILPSATIAQKSHFKPADLKEKYQDIANEKLPSDLTHNQQFDFILQKILSGIKDAMLAHNALYFWYKESDQQLILEQYASCEDKISMKRFPVENDVISKIVKTGEPEHLTDISTAAERDVIRYYDQPQAIKSFVGAPLYFDNKIYGVLVLDSKSPDTFGLETVYTLGKFVRIISVIISLFEEKVVENISSNRLNALLSIISAENIFENENDLIQAIENAVSVFLTWDIFTFVNYDSSEQKFYIEKVSNKTSSLKYIGEGFVIDLSGTLVGKAIASGAVIKVDDISQENRPRYSKNESISIDGSFLAIPLTYANQNYGVLCFESLRKRRYTDADVDFVKRSTKLFPYFLYTSTTNSTLKNLINIDLETKFLNAKAFSKALESELYKTSKIEVPSALALIHIDDFIEESSLFESDPFPKVLKSIANSIRDEVNLSNIVGRLNTRLFGVYFFNAPSRDVFVWAEKLRTNIARKTIGVMSKQTTFTVSIGIANSTNKTDFQEVIYNADLALKKAIEKGGNTVKIL